MDLATAARSTHQDKVHLARVRLYSPAWPEQTWVMRLRETRYDFFFFFFFFFCSPRNRVVTECSVQ